MQLADGRHILMQKHRVSQKSSQNINNLMWVQQYAPVWTKNHMVVSWVEPVLGPILGLVQAFISLCACES